MTKAEATTLRASGNDPGNAKVLAVNLQKAQLVAMIVALINARHLDWYVLEFILFIWIFFKKNYDFASEIFY